MDRMEENGFHNNHTPNCMMITFIHTIKMKLEWYIEYTLDCYHNGTE